MHVAWDPHHRTGEGLLARAMASAQYRLPRAWFALRTAAESAILGKGEFPRRIHVENTNHCNAACIMCPRDKLTRSLGFMDWDLFTKIIDEAATKWQVEEVHLHGFGEPFLDKTLFKKIRYAKDKGIKQTYLVTTAFILKDHRIQDILEAGLDRFKVSFYGATRETYEKIHVPLSFEESRRNVANFLRMRDEGGYERPSLIIQWLPMPENEGENEAFRSMWKPLIDSGKGDVMVEYELHNWIDGRDYNLMDGPKPERLSCGIPFEDMQILFNGDVVPCCYDFDAKLVLGNVRDHTLEEAWNSPPFKHMRDVHRKGTFEEIPLCDECDQLKPKKN